jgi:tetratricopeptide (TPR) repeat protein
MAPVDPQLQFAAQLIANGQVDEAKEIITQMIRADEHNADAWYLAASIMDDPNRQIQALERSLAINPNHQRAQHALENIKAASAPRRGQAAPVHRESSAFTVQNYIETGLVALRHNDGPGAMSAFAKAIRLDPESAEAYVQRGLVYKATQDYANAVADFKQALICDPQHPKARMMQEFVEKVEQPGWLVYQDGLNALDNSDYSRAIDHFTEAIKHNGKDATLYVARARAYQEKANLSAALHDLDKAVQLDSKSPDVLLARGKARALKRDFNGAVNDFSQALKHDAENATAYLERGKAQAEKDNHKGAVADLTKAITIDPELAAAYGYRGLARLHLKDVKGAHEDYEKAVAIEPAQLQATELLIKIEQNRQHKK